MATLDKNPAAVLYEATASTGRSPEIPEADDVYGWFVGSWELAIQIYWGKDVSAERIRGEVHAAWALEGRAVHDVWIMPRRSDRSSDKSSEKGTVPFSSATIAAMVPAGKLGQSPKLDKRKNMYGTTLRAWDASIRAWQIFWSNPAGDHFERQIGRWSGNDVVQLGVRADGTATRWRFTAITADSFHWWGESLAADGHSWNVEGEFLARRTR